MDLDNIDKMCSLFLKEAKKPWSKKPPGWKQKSVKKYYKTMSEESEHPFSKCVEKMEDHMDNPEAFCASVKDIGEGRKNWRNPPKKSKKK